MEYLLWGAIGDAYLEQEQFDISRQAFDKMLTLAERLENPMHEAFAFLRTGRLFYARHEYESAIDDFLKMLRISREKNNPAAEGMALEWMSMAHTKNLDYEAARASLQQARSVYTALDDDNAMRRTGGALVVTYVLLAWDKLLRFLRLR
jgi:tetratricopeptide (TPR) repeat protein